MTFYTVTEKLAYKEVVSQFSDHKHVINDSWDKDDNNE